MASLLQRLAQVNNVCRVCLKSNHQEMVPLHTKLDEHINKDGVYVLQALERVTNVKIVIDERLPNMICKLCLEILKIAFRLCVVFGNSQYALASHMKKKGHLFDGLPCINVQLKAIKYDINLAKSTADAETQCEINLDISTNEVEIVSDIGKFSLGDVLIVEPENVANDPELYSAFLNNLGREVSASFVEKASGRSTHTVDNDEDSIEVCIVKKETFPCDTCGEVFHNEQYRWNHTICEHMDAVLRSLFQDAGARYTCLICGKQEADQTTLFNHNLKVHKKRVFSCPMCEKRFIYHRKVIKHLSTEHGRPKYQNHPSGKKYKCNICNECFRDRSKFASHLEDHSDSSEYINNTAKAVENDCKPYRCKVCGKQYRKKLSLRMHLKMHVHI